MKAGVRFKTLVIQPRSELIKTTRIDSRPQMSGVRTIVERWAGRHAQTSAQSLVHDNLKRLTVLPCLPDESFRQIVV
jgi:hypothetical protein